MSDFTIQKDGSETYTVLVSGSRRTEHIITVPEGVVVDLTGDAGKAEDLVRASFTFLLDREPNVAIMSEFEIETISSYFPEWKREMRETFGRG